MALQNVDISDDMEQACRKAMRYPRASEAMTYMATCWIKFLGLMGWLVNSEVHSPVVSSCFTCRKIPL